MTRIVKESVRCKSCNCEYRGLLWLSYNEGIGGPKPRELKCPVCENPYSADQQLSRESIIGNPSALDGYDKENNIFLDKSA